MQVLSAVVLVCVVGGALSWSANKYQNQILQWQNDYRRREGGGNMWKMEWDEGLASSVDQWMQGCNFNYGNDNYGENYAFYYGNDDMNNMQQAFKDWYNEREFYNYNNNNCGYSCRYTQMVWYNSHHVGCAINHCPELNAFGQQFKNTWFFGCWYDPKGNYGNEYPYYPGEPCSECIKNGYSCDDGLCYEMEMEKVEMELSNAGNNFDMNEAGMEMGNGNNWNMGNGNNWNMGNGNNWNMGFGNNWNQGNGFNWNMGGSGMPFGNGFNWWKMGYGNNWNMNNGNNWNNWNMNNGNWNNMNNANWNNMNNGNWDMNNGNWNNMNNGNWDNMNNGNWGNMNNDNMNMDNGNSWNNMNMDNGNWNMDNFNGNMDNFNGNMDNGNNWNMGYGNNWNNFAGPGMQMGSNWQGWNTQGGCQDYFGSCMNFMNNGDCQKYSNFMSKYCQQSCGWCNGDSNGNGNNQWKWNNNNNNNYDNNNNYNNNNNNDVETTTKSDSDNQEENDSLKK